MDNQNLSCIVEIFEKVQKIPYKCRSKYPENLSIDIPYANCIQKRDLLRKCIESCNYKSRNLDAVFDWKDLPIPEHILEILKMSGTKQKHHLLEVWIKGTYLKVDPTWNLELENRGFPVTRLWKGDRDTIQVTKGEIFFYNPELQKVFLPYFPEEREEFAREFNSWLGW